jgi:DNA-binding response OmpR family regulator
MVRPVLIVEDDPDIAEGLRYNLEREKLETRVALTGELGLSAALDQNAPPSLVILDLMLPGMTGLELCRRLRREPSTRRTPIIMVTASSSDVDIAAGLDLGADDYITKPFSMREVLARVRSVLRRVEDGTTTPYDDGRMRIDYDEMRVFCGGVSIRLTRKEYGLLCALVASSGRVATRKFLLESVWGHDHYGDERTVDVHIRRLRSALGDSAEAIETVVGIGYRFLGCKLDPPIRALSIET